VGRKDAFLPLTLLEALVYLSLPYSEFDKGPSVAGLGRKNLFQSAPPSQGEKLKSKKEKKF
jgi:hypothetical protein